MSHNSRTHSETASFGPYYFAMWQQMLQHQVIKKFMKNCDKNYPKSLCLLEAT
jgi:hypothetical protein